MAVYLRDLFTRLGADHIFEDNSSPVTGSDTGNYVVRFAGSRQDLDPVFFNCHLDVIGPCHGVKVRKVDDIFYSSGSTVLGADDKAGIAILLEVITSFLEQGISFAPVEFLFTTCEEIGLLGAKAFDPALLHAQYGYALDSTGIDNVIKGAPAAHTVIAEIYGLASHAGLRPQHGINAIQLAAQSIASLKLGLVDHETTANIGIIDGGSAVNIIPDHVKVQGEIRSHSLEKLSFYIDQFRSVFQKNIDCWSDPAGLISAFPSLHFTSPMQYPLMRLEDDNPALLRARRAGDSLSRSLHFINAGGGSDANIFNSFGLSTAILGIGMQHVHSTSECISLSHMLRTAELVVSILTS